MVGKTPSIQEKIVDFARDLWLQFDEVGKRKYSVVRIAEDIEKKFKKKVNPRTIDAWAKKHNWKVLFDEAKTSGFLQALNNFQENRDNLTRSLGSEFQELYRGTLSRYKISSQIVERWLGENLKKLNRLRNAEKVRELLNEILPIAADLMKKDYDSLIKVFDLGMSDGDFNFFNLAIDNSSNTTITISDEEKMEIAKQYNMVDKMMKLRAETSSDKRVVH